MDKGFITLYRKMTEWEWYDDLPTFRLFICLLFLVNWEDKKWHGQTIKRGQIITSISHLSDESGLTVKQVRRALDNLQSTEEVIVEPTNKYTKVTVQNYSKYQDKGKQKTVYKADKQCDTEETNNEQGKQRANKGQTKGKQRATTKPLEQLKPLNNNIYSQLQNSYNDICTSLSKCIAITDKRKQMIDARLKDYTVEDFEKVFKLAQASDFLSGRNGKWNSCNFDWLIRPNNFVKVIEGTYNKNNKKIEKGFLSG